MFKSAIRDRLITVSPCVDVKLPEKPRREVVPLTVDQVADLARLVPDRHRALIVLGAGCGLGLSEAVGVTVDRVNFLGRTVTVGCQLVTPPKGAPRFGPVKRAASNRVVPLPKVVADSLAFHLQQFGQGPDGLIFTNVRGLPIRRSSFSGTSDVPATRWGSAPVTAPRVAPPLRILADLVRVLGDGGAAEARSCLGAGNARHLFPLVAGRRRADDERGRQIARAGSC